MNLFGKKIKHLRELNGLLQRDVAQKLAIDAPMLSKIESGERNVKREHVANLCKIFKVPEEDLLSLWLADKVYDIVKDEEMAIKAMHVAEDVIKTKNKKRTT